MRKVIIGFVVLISVILCIAIYLLYLQGIDTNYAINYSKVIRSYDIAQVDTFLNDDTTITYKDTTETYKELRHNVISAFKDKKFIMDEHSSYGHGDNRFVKGVQTVGIQSYVTIDSKSIENYIVMQLEKIGLNSFKVKSLKSNDEFFGYLFFGAE